MRAGDVEAGSTDSPTASDGSADRKAADSVRDAAPAMLKVLRDIHRFALLTNERGFSTYEFDANSQIGRALRAAIAKAEGRDA